MDSHHILSIITINFNNKKGLATTFKSILDQKFNDYEWIVIDGASTDDSLSIFHNTGYPDIIITEPDDGIYDAMRKGLSIASSDYVIFMNAGDSFFDDASLVNASPLLESNLDVYYFSTRIIDQNRSWLRRARSFNSTKYSVPAVQQATIYKRAALQKIEWPTKFKICGDYYIAAQLYASNAQSISSTIILSNFEIGGISTSNFKELANEAFEIQRNTLKLSALYCSISYIRRILTGMLIYAINKLK